MSIIFDNILGSIKNFPDRNAFCINNVHYTYKIFSEHIAGIILELNASSKENKCIGIVEHNNIETYASILAVLLSGNTYVIINPSNPINRNKTILKSTNIDTILSSDSIPNELLTKDTKLINTCRKKSNINLDTLYIPQDQNSLAYIIFTSGSTGIPKGVPISRKNLNSFYAAYSQTGIKVTEEDRMLQMFDLCFDVSVVSLLYPLTKGACVYTISQNKVKYTQVYELLEDEKLTFATIAPSLLSYLQPYFEEISLPHLKCLILTAEASNWELLSQFIKCVPNAQLYNFYGPTEATIYCTSYPLDINKVDTYNGMLAIGHPFSGIDAVIVDEFLTEVNTGEKGELCVSGKQIMGGYWQDEQKTNDALVTIGTNGTEKTYYKTGDICYKNKEGCIFYCGRKDYQVQIQGFRVELNEVEYVARQFHTKGNCVVIAETNSFGNLELHLFMEKFSGNEGDVVAYYKEKLPIYMCPSKIYSINEFPLNTNGKVDRKELQKLLKLEPSK